MQTFIGQTHAPIYLQAIRNIGKNRSKETSSHIS